MNRSEAAELLAVAAHWDRRTIGKTDAAAWAKALTPLEPAACANAIVDHFQASTEYLTPAHVRARVKAVKTELLISSHSAEVLGGVAEARAVWNPEASHRGYLAASAALAEALTAKKARSGVGVTVAYT